MTSYSRIWFSLIFFSALVSCVKADKGQRADQKNLETYSVGKSLISFNNRALFEAGDIVLEEIDFSNVNEGDWRQADSIQLFMKVCNIRDRASQGTIRNERFHIRSELGSNIMWRQDGERAQETNQRSNIHNPITVNSGNCLRWTQVVPVFDFLAPSVNIALHFEIESLSGNLGKVVKRIGFNPWDRYRNNSQTRGFIDLTDFDQSQWGEGQWVTGQQNVISALKGELYDNDGALHLKIPFTVDVVEREQQRVAQYNESLQGLSEEERQIRQEIDQRLLREQGLHINVNMNARPFVRLNDSSGVPHDIDISTGQFKIYMNLVASGASDDSRKYLLSSNVSDVTGRSASFLWNMTPNGLLASVPLVLRNRTEFGRVEMVLKVVPVSPGLRRLKPFMGVFDMGNYDSWARRGSPQPKFDENFQPMTQTDYSAYINNVDGIVDDLQTIREQDRFYFGPLDLRFVRLMPGESATDRTLQYRVETCVEHGLYGNRVGRGLQFDITTTDQGRQHKMRRATNEAGCITWFGFLSHKYYRREVLERKIGEVRFVGTINNGAEDVRNNISQWDTMINQYEHEFVYYMNPWDEKWTFGWDEPDMPEGYAEEIQRQRETAPVSKLFIADFRYETMGFRYAIDKYLNMKVKKAVLLKAYPYVLKYNSIVRGRLGTEKLRDGVYLMKVALQKDYLDPAAKGVRIYDEGMIEPIQMASVDEPSNFVIDPELNEDGISYEEYLSTPFADAFPGAFDQLGVSHHSEDGGDTLVEGVPSRPRLVYSDTGRVRDEANIDHQLLSSESLREEKKEFISVQTKLVRVLGGMIITPIEFEVDDLRLMRIRNQFFIQLQTIDEHKLRLATLIDETLNQMFEDGELEEQFAQIFSDLAIVEDLGGEDVQQAADDYHAGRLSQEAMSDYENFEAAKQRLYNALGLFQFEEGSEEFAARKEAIVDKLHRLQEYRYAVQGGLDELAAFRNEKRMLINDLIFQVGLQNDQIIEENSDADVLADDREVNDREVDQDPLLQFFFMDTHTPGSGALGPILQYRRDRAERTGQGNTAETLDDLRFADFTESPLTPSFDLEMLTNDGEHDPSVAPDDGKSGLPSRTFIGPLTFVFNTNGSSLRPTDILNERYCRTAFCETDELIDAGVPPTDIEVSLGETEAGDANQIVDTPHAIESRPRHPIYDSGDSVNANYENNKYYGYLKAYHGVTVDDLIAEKREVEERKTRKMEEGSQIINYTKTMGLKYLLLNDHPRSRLKGIDHNCAQTIDIDRIGTCFNDITSGPDVMRKSLFYEMLNERAAAPGLPEVVSRNYSTPGNLEEYNRVEGDVEPEHLQKVMEHGWRNTNEVDPQVSRRLFHRMCHVLTQNLLKPEFHTGNDIFTDIPEPEPAEGFESLSFDMYEIDRDPHEIDIEGEHDDPPSLIRADMVRQTIAYRSIRTLSRIEKLCHRYVGNLYNYSNHGFLWRNYGPEHEDVQPGEVKYPPIIFERKVRAYNTTGRYVYRGGKSLNLNLTTSFNLSSSNGIKISTSAGYKPWDWVKDGLGKIPLVGPALKFIAGGFGLTRTNSRDESAGRTQGVNVSSGTFLVSQQATFDIELASYERCMVVRFHPALLAEAIGELNEYQRKQGLRSFDDDLISHQGMLICTGIPSQKCLPIKEKYYYFTQHFTEGDMLDTADLHNHPWLLQLRGYRDFLTFTSMVGAREVDYIDNNNWLSDVSGRTLTDAATFNFNGSHVENQKPELRVVERSDINWPLEELSRTYFNVLPTFPGLYTYLNETGETVAEWPYDADATDPGQAFTRCEQ